MADTPRLSFRTFLRAAIFYENPKHTRSRPLSVEGLEVDLWSSLYWFSPQPTVCPYHATVGLFFIRTPRTTVLRDRKTTFIGTVFHSTRRRSTTHRLESPYPGNRASSILYDRAANLSVVIRNSAEQEMNLTPVPVLLLFSLFLVGFSPSQLCLVYLLYLFALHF